MLNKSRRSDFNKVKLIDLFGFLGVINKIICSGPLTEV